MTSTFKYVVIEADGKTKECEIKSIHDIIRALDAHLGKQRECYSLSGLDGFRLSMLTRSGTAFSEAPVNDTATVLMKSSVHGPVVIMDETSDGNNIKSFGKVQLRFVLRQRLTNGKCALPMPTDAPSATVKDKDGHEWCIWYEEDAKAKEEKERCTFWMSHAKQDKQDQPLAKFQLMHRRSKEDAFECLQDLVEVVSQHGTERVHTIFKL